MSLATRCPACGTIFRVVQDQLKVSEGWVRCGQCHEVFHGIEALFDLDSDPAIAARRAAAARAPVAPPPTRVFAQQRANAPIPAATPTPATPPPASPIAIPARAPAPAPAANAPARQSVPASPSAFGASDYPPSAPVTRPGYTGFTPATRPIAPPPAPLPPPPAPLPPAAPTPMAPVTTRSTIAPRFAARLAEESARTQVLTPSQIPPRSPPPPTTAPAPLAPAPSPAPFAGTLAQRNTAPAWQTPPTPAAVPATAPAAFAPPPVPNAPEPERAQAPLITPLLTPLVTPIPTPPAPISASAADLAAEFAAPVPATSAPDLEPASAPVVEPVGAREATPDIDDSPVLPNDAAEDLRAGPPTLASMLPEDAGDWPPKRVKKRAPEVAAATSELEVVDRSKDPRFLREAKSGARWRRPWVRAALSVTLLLLFVAAAVQVAWPQRDTLASRWPVTLPAWQWLCEQAECKIEAPRAIASLALDGSSLTRTDTEHVLLFSADLHNRADHEVRMPSFDVTFMDLNGEIVARKVLTPDEIGIHQAALPAEGELHVHARLQVGTLAASGFQADLFYP